jgi:eukaryotic-like serine/threonine-protein kinase
VGALLEPLTEDDPPTVGRFLIRARLGAGGMGRVYLASTEGGRPVAVKVMRSEIGLNPEFRERFRQEVEAARRVHGFYTAQVIDADPDAPQPWLATVYVPAPSLHQVVREHGALPEASVLQLMAGIGEALQAIHAAGIVHRDLKPSNVLLASDGPRVIDFGIARMAEAAALTRVGTLVGSPGYMAPEQILGGPAGPAIDVFALGSLTAFAAQGYGPFGDDGSISVLHRVTNQPAVLSGCPPRVLSIVERCLEKDPARRPTPREIIDYCRRATAGQAPDPSQSWLPAPVAATVTQQAVALTPPPLPPSSSPTPLRPSPPQIRPIPVPGPPQRTSRKTMAGVAVGALALAVIAGALVYSFESGNSNNTNTDGSTNALGTQSPSVPAATDPEASDPADQTAPWYSGTWTGTVNQPTGTVTKWTVKITLPKVGSTGVFSSPSLGCSGSVTIITSAADQVSMEDDLAYNPQQICVNGYMTLTEAGDGRASFAWQDATDAQNVGTGPLTHE